MSNLLKNSLLQTNTHLSRRVHAAVIQVAGEQSGAEGAGGVFARMVQNDLARSWPDFLLSVAADPSVQNASVINEDATAVITTNVTDDQILNSINYMWASVSKKYAPQPDTSHEEPAE
jgi:hypothetical protein